MSPTEKLQSYLRVPTIQRMSKQVWGELAQNTQAAIDFAANLAEDVNWHSLSIPGADFTYEIADGATSYRTVKNSLHGLESVAAFILSLLSLAGAKSAAQVVMRQALKEVYNQEARVASSRTIMSDKTLRTNLIRLAHQKPELRAALLPLLKKACGEAGYQAEDDGDEKKGCDVAGKQASRKTR